MCGIKPMRAAEGLNMENGICILKTGILRKSSSYLGQFWIYWIFERINSMYFCLLKQTWGTWVDNVT